MDIDYNEKDTARKFDWDKFSHAIEILKAAFPHLDSDTQQSAEIIVKTGELMEAVHRYRQRNRITAYHFKRNNVDIEALLTSIRSVCYDQEREFVDTILNIIKAKNLYDTYTAYASAMANQSDNTENSGEESGSNNRPDMMEILSSLLTPEQKSTFDDLNTMFNVVQQ
ncbi:MAG: NR LBD domain-containing protein [Lachnoclostridium sp.]|jgi:hypothetical protein